jgi:hypothetical protein
LNQNKKIEPAWNSGDLRFSVTMRLQRRKLGVCEEKLDWDQPGVELTQACFFFRMACDDILYVLNGQLRGRRSLAIRRQQTSCPRSLLISRTGRLQARILADGAAIRLEALPAPVKQNQHRDGRSFASSAERPGSGSPRTSMFGVSSAAHAACRSARTSLGAARNSAIV